MGFSFVLVLVLLIELLQLILRKDNEQKKQKGRLVVEVVLAVCCMVYQLYTLTPEAPSITPYGQILSPNQEEILIENSKPTPIYYSFDTSVDPRDGIKYTGPIHKEDFPQLPFTIAARSIFTFGPFHWESSRTEQSFRAPGPADGYTEGSVPDESIEEIGEAAGAESTTVSSQRTLSYDALPDGILSGWGDNSGGRESYTIDEINAGALGDQIIFNAIKDSPIGDEKNFVGARVNDGINAGANNVWNGNLIEVEEGKSYYVRLYCHNNSPLGYDAVAKDVSACFLIPSETGRTVVVNGLLQSSNAMPGRYWDSVAMTADRPFHLEYIPGSALLENNGIGADGGILLSDKIAEGEWTPLGYSSLNGELPGCYSYSLCLTIQVTPIFDD